MRRTFRSCMLVGSFAALAPALPAEEPTWKNPIAASNSLTIPALPPVKPREARSVISAAPAEKTTTVAGPASVTAYVPAPAAKPAAAPQPVVVAPAPAEPVLVAPVPAEPPVAPPQPAAAPPVPVQPAVVAPRPAPAPPPTMAVMAPPTGVTWTAPRAATLGSAMPVSERPMMPCEPVNTVPPPAPPKPVTTTAAKLTAVEPAAPVAPLATCRMCDPADARPSMPPDATFAVVRREGAAPVRPVDVDRLRQEVIAACREVGGEVETQALPDKQVKVTVAVRSARDWGILYARLQGLTELGDYGLVIQSRIKK